MSQWEIQTCPCQAYKRWRKRREDTLESEMSSLPQISTSLSLSMKSFIIFRTKARIFCCNRSCWTRMCFWGLYGVLHTPLKTCDLWHAEYLVYSVWEPDKIFFVLLYTVVAVKMYRFLCFMLSVSFTGFYAEEKLSQLRDAKQIHSTWLVNADDWYWTCRTLSLPVEVQD